MYGWQEEDTAPYISHLGFNQVAGQDPMLFGLTHGHNHGGNAYNEGMYIFHAVVDPATKDLKN